MNAIAQLRFESFATNRAALTHLFRRVFGAVAIAWCCLLLSGCQGGPAATTQAIQSRNHKADQAVAEGNAAAVHQAELTRRAYVRESKTRIMLADLAEPSPSKKPTSSRSLGAFVDTTTVEMTTIARATSVARDDSAEGTAKAYSEAQVAYQEFFPSEPCPDCLPPLTNSLDCLPEMQIVAADEYICDGGDSQLQVVVDPDWTVRGIDPTDTIAHYDTRQGQTLVDASNRVCIYSPRFAAVRKIDGAVQNSYALAVGDFDRTLRVLSQDRNAVVSTTLQPLEPKRNVGTQAANLFKERQAGVPADHVARLFGVRDHVPPFEDFRIIQDGVAEQTEQLRLNAWVDVARFWMINKAVQITIDGQPAIEAAVGVLPGETVHYEVQGKSRLRIVKVASTKDALPGDTVDFTLRFDNVGDQTIGNVTILDHLTNRLEYVEGSQTCSLEHSFLSEQKPETIVLRWEITQPLKVGEGGVIRFQCVVR